MLYYDAFFKFHHGKVCGNIVAEDGIQSEDAEQHVARDVGADGESDRDGESALIVWMERQAESVVVEVVNSSHDIANKEVYEVVDDVTFDCLSHKQ